MPISSCDCPYAPAPSRSLCAARETPYSSLILLSLKVCYEGPRVREVIFSHKIFRLNRVRCIPGASFVIAFVCFSSMFIMIVRVRARARHKCDNHTLACTRVFFGRMLRRLYFVYVTLAAEPCWQRHTQQQRPKWNDRSTGNTDEKLIIENRFACSQIRQAL